MLRQVSTKTDIWSLGGVLTSMVVGGPIWPADIQPMEVMMTVAVKRGSPEVPAATPAPLADVLRKCFATAQVDRPTAEQLVSLLLHTADALDSGGGAGQQQQQQGGDGLSLPPELRGVAIFISYFSAESQDLYQSLTAQLTMLGCKVFQPTQDLVSPSSDEMRANVAASDLAFSIWSPAYPFSKWCRHEAHEAVVKSIPLVPVYNGDKAMQKAIIDGLDRRDAILNAVFSKNIVKVQDVSESSETTTRRLVDTVVKHALRPGRPRPAPLANPPKFTAQPPSADEAVALPDDGAGLVHAGDLQEPVRKVTACASDTVSACFAVHRVRSADASRMCLCGCVWKYRGLPTRRRPSPAARPQRSWPRCRRR